MIKNKSNRLLTKLVHEAAEESDSAEESEPSESGGESSQEGSDAGSDASVEEGGVAELTGGMAVLLPTRCRFLHNRIAVQRHYPTQRVAMVASPHLIVTVGTLTRSTRRWSDGWTSSRRTRTSTARGWRAETSAARATRELER